MQKIIFGAAVGVVCNVAKLLITKDIRDVTKEDCFKAAGVGAVVGAVAGPVLIGKDGVPGYVGGLVSNNDSPSLLQQYLPMVDNFLGSLPTKAAAGIALACGVGYAYQSCTELTGASESDD